MEAKPKVYLLPRIVENVMKYLSIRDLRTCQKLSRLWNDLATREIYRRQYFVPFSHGPYCLTHHSFHPTSKECRYSYPPKLSEDTLNDYMKGMSAASAQMCITFVTTGFAAWYETDSNRHSEDRIYEPLPQQDAKMLIQNTLMHHLSRSAIPQLFVAHGIVSWSNDGVPLESEDGYGMSGVMIPDDPELKIYTCGPEDIYESKQENLVKCSLLKRIPKDVDIKCLLLFAESSDVFCKYMNFAKACQDRQSTLIAVGALLLASLMSDSDTDSDTEMRTDSGRKNAKKMFCMKDSRIINSVPYSDTDSKMDYDTESDAAMERDFDVYNCQVIAFCGESVEAASVIIYSLDGEETILRNLSEFQEIRLRKKKCLAFMFRNTRHAFRSYKIHNYESSLFHRLYPDVPVIGAFGIGMLGMTPDPNYAEKSLDSVNNIAEDSYVIHGHKTVFVFIGI